MNKHLGSQTIAFQNPPSVLSFASVVGKKEGEGPLGALFDRVEEDAYLGADSWEKAESALVDAAIQMALTRGNVSAADVQFLIAGDLLDQCVASVFGLCDTAVSYLGVYGACSTMAESLCIGAMLLDGGFADRTLCATSSHFCSAEKQFRFPLEYGAQRPPSAQWTVTGSGAVLLGTHGAPPYITHATIGKMVDKGVTDANNMGAAMAPAFVDTLMTHLKDTGQKPSDYDLILSGDLGAVGKALAIELAAKEGLCIASNFDDCGCRIFDSETQNTAAGGSGCGCAASVLCADILPQLVKKKLHRVLFMPTGALMSPTSTLQGQSIPSISHAVVLQA